MASAELDLPKIFGDNMVIQRDEPIHVWGSANPGKNVRVILGKRDLTTKANEQGKWSLELDSLQGSVQALSLIHI